MLLDQVHFFSIAYLYFAVVVVVVVVCLREGEGSSIQCLANNPNQQHIIACGNLNGFIFIYDVRNQKKPFIMSHAYSEPGNEWMLYEFNYKTYK